MENNQVVMQKNKGFRVVLFPFPFQGHLNPMLQLANILHSVGFTITIIHTNFNSPNHSNYPHFTFFSIPDDAPDTKSDTGEIQAVVDLIAIFNRNCQAPFRDCLARMISDDSKDPIACIITDAHWNCTQAVANSFNIRRIVLRTSSLSSILVFAAHPLFREKGYLSISNQDDSISEAPVVELPPLKFKDIPMIFTSKPDSLCKPIDNMINGIKASSGLIWNSFSELEEPALQKIHQLLPVPTFTIGPFHKYFPASNSSLLQQDQTSISWLKSQPPKSVLYVSFGSIAAMDQTEFMEIAWGLANSMQPFLWVVRPGMVRGSEWIELLPSEFVEGLGGRGHIVKWAPQQEVLAHPSTGGFWTHNGWNSTLESICEGVPMICSPCFGDQHVNARYVSEVWKVGIQLEKGLERDEIQTMIRRLMVEREGARMREKLMELKETGHINSMLKLAELLCLSGLHITFIVSAKIKDSLIRLTNVQSRFDSYPGFLLESLPETFREIPAHNLMENYISLKAVSQPFLSDLLLKNRLSSDTRRPVTSIISDGVFSFLIDIAQQIGIPIYYFRTISSCAFWAYFSIKQLIETQELPFQGLDLDVRVSSVQGMERFLRRRDLPSFCRVGDVRDEALQMLSTETQQTTRVDGLIFNTFEDLEGPVLANIRTKCPNLYTIGPLHTHLKARLPSTSGVQWASSNSLLEEDKSCMTWLDLQPLKSVLYVSFGSVATLKREELMEFWYGLVNSGQRFLWVRRPNSVAGEEEGEIPVEVVEGTRERGYLVGWAPQEEVLAHPAVGGFLTHSGWNSTMESIVEGVPMICWPYFADQQVNSRFVGQVWKLGLDMKDTCDRVVVENMVRDLMVERREEFVTLADKTAKLARKSVREGGSSYSNLDRLVEDIKKSNSN